MNVKLEKRSGTLFTRKTDIFVKRMTITDMFSLLIIIDWVILYDSTLFCARSVSMPMEHLLLLLLGSSTKDTAGTLFLFRITTFGIP
jgi:hypothetical protein